MTVAKKYSDQTFTLSEYLALPENDRMEILEGMPYLLASPSMSHQNCALAFASAFRAALSGKPCQAFIAPLDVFLDEADERKPTVVRRLRPEEARRQGLPRRAGPHHRGPFPRHAPA